MSFPNFRLKLSTKFVLKMHFLKISVLVFLIVLSVIVVKLLIMWKSQCHVQFDELCLGGESILKQRYLCVDSNAFKW